MRREEAAARLAPAGVDRQGAREDPLRHAARRRPRERCRHEPEVLALVEIERLAEQRLLVAEGGVEAWPVDAHRSREVAQRRAPRIPCCGTRGSAASRALSTQKLRGAPRRRSGCCALHGADVGPRARRVHRDGGDVTDRYRKRLTAVEAEPHIPIGTKMEHRMAKLDDKIALITGGTTGIGAATARRFQAEGATVIVTGSNPTTLDAARRDMAGIEVIGSDAGDPAASKALIDEVVSRHGRIDVLFVNAGIAKFAPSSAVDEAFFDAQFDINVRGRLLRHEACGPGDDGRGRHHPHRVGRRVFGGWRDMPSMPPPRRPSARSGGPSRSSSRPAASASTTISPGPIETPHLRQGGHPGRPARRHDAGDDGPDPVEADRPVRGGRGGGPVLRLRRVVLHHGRRTLRRRRHDGRVTAGRFTRLPADRGCHAALRRPEDLRASDITPVLRRTRARKRPTRHDTLARNDVPALCHPRLPVPIGSTPREPTLRHR